jgi:hypothetical protein
MKLLLLLLALAGGSGAQGQAGGSGGAPAAGSSAIPAPMATGEGAFALGLPTHAGKLEWHASGYKPIEVSAKNDGEEIGIRALGASGSRTFLGFLFLIPEAAPLSSAKCRDGVLDDERSNGAAITQVSDSELTRPKGPPVDVIAYTAASRGGKITHVVRGFVATGDLCGDLEFYSDSAIDAKDPEIAKTFASYRLDPTHAPTLNDIMFYAQTLYQHQAFSAAAPLFEKALAKLPADASSQTMRRGLTDQAGMAFGIAGNLPKSRAIFSAAVAKDPDYPLYYYNLACADAAEDKLADARTHLQQAWNRRANMLPGETFPDPSKDDSFTPHQSDKDFWAFVTSLH